MNKNIFLLCITIILITCKGGDVEDVNYIGRDLSKYVSVNDPNSKSMLAEIASQSDQYSSFKGEFTMKVQVFVPKKDTFTVDGKIYFSKSGGLVKIQLMDSFFGLIFTELIASPTEIRIKPSGSTQATSQPMGDLLLQDPNTRKTILLPFPVIYQYLSGNFQSEVISTKARFLLKENRILIDKKDGAYEYFFEAGLLNRIELTSPARGIKAVSLVKDKDRQHIHPAKSILSKVMTLKDETENALILITMKKISKVEISDSIFNF